MFKYADVTISNTYAVAIVYVGCYIESITV